MPSRRQEKKREQKDGLTDGRVCQMDAADETGAISQTQLGLRRPQATSHPPALENIDGWPVTREIILADHRQKVIDHIEGRTTENVKTYDRGVCVRDHARRNQDQK